MADFPIDTAQIVALFLESVLYGVYLVTFVACLRVLLITPSAAAASHPAYPSLHLPPPTHHTHTGNAYNGYTKSFALRDYFKPLRHINKPMLLAALLMLVFATLDVAFGLHNNILAFVKTPPVVVADDGTEEGGPEAVFDDIGRWTNVMKMVNYVAQTFVGDSILVRASSLPSYSLPLPVIGGLVLTYMLAICDYVALPLLRRLRPQLVGRRVPDLALARHDWYVHSLVSRRNQR